MRKSYSICEVLRQVGTNLREMCAKVRESARFCAKIARICTKFARKSRKKSRKSTQFSRTFAQNARKIAQNARNFARKIAQNIARISCSRNARNFRAVFVHFAQFFAQTINTPDFNSGQKWSSARGDQRRKTGAMCEGFRGGVLEDFVGASDVGDDVRGISSGR